MAVLLHQTKFSAANLCKRLRYLRLSTSLGRTLHVKLKSFMYSYVVCAQIDPILGLSDIQPDNFTVMMV